MTISTPVLRRALESLSTSVGRRATPMTGCVKLQAEHDRLTISATNGDVYQVEAMSCNGELESSCVNFTHLQCSLGSSPSVSLVNKSGTLQVKCKSGSSNLATLPAQDFPLPPETKAAIGLGISCEDLAAGIRAVNWCSSHDQGKPVLMSCHIIGKPKMLTCEAADGVNGAFFDRPLICADFELLVPEMACGKLADALEQQGAILSTTDNIIFVTHANGGFYTKQLSGKYPSYAVRHTYKHLTIGECAMADFMPVIDECCQLHDPQQTPKASLTFGADGLRVEFNGLASTMDKTVAGKYEQHTCMVNVESVRKCLKGIKADKFMFFRCDEVPSLGLKAGDVSVISMCVRG